MNDQVWIVSTGSWDMYEPQAIFTDKLAAFEYCNAMNTEGRRVRRKEVVGIEVIYRVDAEPLPLNPEPPK